MAIQSTLLRAQERTPRPWKNGGGLTTEIAVYPKQASLDAFHWRVSTAEVRADGPFSEFPGVDRSLALLDGAGMLLSIKDDTPVRLTCDDQPYAFAADRPCQAHLLDGPIIDLNVMSRREAWRHSVERIDVNQRYSRASAATPWLVFCRNGNVRVATTLEAHDLNPQDAVVGDGDRIEITATIPSVIYIIEFYRV